MTSTADAAPPDVIVGRSPAMWGVIEELIRTSTVVIDRPSGSAHPRFPEIVYPVDYGYLQDTQGGDGEGIDLWRGTAEVGLVGLVATFDAWKRNAEVKYVVGVTDDELGRILDFYRSHQLEWTLIRRG